MSVRATLTSPDSQVAISGEDGGDDVRFAVRRRRSSRIVRLQPVREPEDRALRSTAREGRSARTSGHFRFQPPPGVDVYPGQMVDVYIGAQDATAVRPLVRLD